MAARAYGGVSGLEWDRYDRLIESMDRKALLTQLKNEARVRAAAEAEIKRLGNPFWFPPPRPDDAS